MLYQLSYTPIYMNFISRQIGAQRSGSDLERKKEPTDMESSRRLRKPRKRNGVGCF